MKRDTKNVYIFFRDYKDSYVKFRKERVHADQTTEESISLALTRGSPKKVVDVCSYF